MSRILLIETDPVMASGLRGNLEEEGFEVEEARDGTAGLRSAADGGYDLILLDALLPEQSGLDVLEELRNAGDPTPVILLSAHNVEDDRIRALRLGADDYLTKPFSLRELLVRIRTRTRDARRVALLHEAIAATTGGGDLQQTLAALIEKALGLTGAERGIVLLAREDGALAVEIARTRQGDELDKELRFSTSIVDRVHRNGRAETLLDTEDGLPWRGGSVHDLKLRNILCAPLRSGDQRVGVLYVDSQFRVQGFDRTDLDLFETLADQCGVAVEKARLRRAQRENRRMEQSLHEAKHIQRAMMPAEPLTGCSVEVAGLNRPAEETGGDYYDYIPLEDNRLAVVMGDVVGHGLSAALFMTAARSLLRAFLPRTAGPGEALEEVNRALSRDLPPGAFMSLFLGELDTRTGDLRYASAGHNPALLHRVATDTFEELGPTGPALGVVDDTLYHVERVDPLRAHDLLLLYTDGVTEAKGAGDERFGMERLMRSLHALRGRPASEVVEGLAAEVTDYCGVDGLDDDCSLVAVKASDVCRFGTSSLQG